MPHLTPWQDHHGSFFTGAKILITGGAGFIGSHLSEALIELGAEVVVLDDLSGGDIANLGPFRQRAGERLSFVEGSLLDQDLLAKIAPGCRFIYHQAAWGSVPRSVEMPRHYHETNTTGTLNVLEAAREAGVQRVMFAASSSAYGDSPTLPKIEDMPVRPKSPYAATKVAGEALMRAYAGCYGLDTVSLRYFNIFGPRQNANSAYAAVIAAFAKALLAGERPRIHGDGEQSRDFTFVENAVQANLLAARAEQPLGGEVLNVACGGKITVNELAEKMAAILGRSDLTAEHGPERAGDVKHSLAELSKTQAAIGYEPVVDFDRGLEVTTRWYEQTMGQDTPAAQR
ncbi:MAG: NAD-dependent epimerase/dehydratase family protein [Phycisphaeraceae bacterium]